jgi:multiple antibiotic resistance protein
LISTIGFRVNRGFDCAWRQIPTAPILYLAGSIALASGAMLVWVSCSRTPLRCCVGSETGALVVVRLMAFILLWVGIQIMWNSWVELNGMMP